MLPQPTIFPATLRWLNFDPAFTGWQGWLALVAFIAVLVMIIYLYTAQSQVASQRIVRWLTGIRVSLIVLIGLLLLRPMFTLHHSEKINETLWVVLDQSLSMNQKDPQSTQIERLRWADALGMIPPESRPSKLDRAAVRLSSLHDDLLQLQSQNRTGADEREDSRQVNDLMASLKNVSAGLADVTQHLEKDPKLQSADAGSITHELRVASDNFANSLTQARDQKTAVEASGVVPWAKTGETIQNAQSKLTLLADQSDAEFLGQHLNDSVVQNALAKVTTLRRADIAYTALTENAHVASMIEPPQRSTDMRAIISLIIAIIGCLLLVWQIVALIIGMGSRVTGWIIAGVGLVLALGGFTAWAAFAGLGDSIIQLMATLSLLVAVVACAFLLWQIVAAIIRLGNRDETFVVAGVGLVVALAGFSTWIILSRISQSNETAAEDGNPRALNESMADVLNRQSTHVVTFAGGQQIVRFAEKEEIPKAIQGGLEPAGTSTDLNSALKFVGDQISQSERASVLVVSDGRVNEGGDPAAEAQRLAARGIRVFALGVGSRQVAPDASVDLVDAPQWVYKDDTLKATGLIRLDGLGGQPVKIDFLRGNTLIDSHTVTPTGDHITSVETFKDKPPEAGVYGYTIRVQEMPKEVVRTNNSQDFRVMVKDDKLHVILVQDQPRWEDRYLANYLKRDNRVQLQQVWMEPAHISDVKPPEPVKASPTSKGDVAQLLPTTAEEWSAFDLIVLGDVPPNLLPTETQNNIAKAVRDRGTALLVVAGQLNMPFRYAGTPLEELLPVHLASNWTVPTLASHAKFGFKVEVSPEGQNSVFSTLDLDDKKNAEYWSAMGLEDNRWYWHSQQTQAKQSASVIWQIGDLQPSQANDSDALTSARQRALLATMPVGMGRVLYLSSPETWRMRQVDGANLHERFWGQVVRWVVQSDMPAGGRFVRFGAKNKIMAGSPVVVSIRVLKEDFTPRTGEHFKVVARKVTQKNGDTGAVQGGDVIASADAVEAPESPGLYRATFNDLKPGGIEISLQGDNIEKILANDPSATQKTLLVDVLSGTDLELRNVNADYASLASIAHAGNGVATDVAYADVLGQRIPDRSHPQDSVEHIGVFADAKGRFTKTAHFVFLALFVGLITTEWIVRKVGGLV